MPIVQEPSIQAAPKPEVMECQVFPSRTPSRPPERLTEAIARPAHVGMTTTLDASSIPGGRTRMEDGLEHQVEIVAEACPDASKEEIRAEFIRYREEFLIPPEDAIRSVTKKFSAGASEPEMPSQSAPTERKVERFDDLGADDRNVTIEVEVITCNPRVQMVRGEERQISFGWIEDRPWTEGGERTRWDFKDWGDHSSRLTPGSIVRLEGVSVNEWQGKRSINVNRGSRVTTLREGSAPVIAPEEPVSIEAVHDMQGMVSVVARVLSAKPDVIHRRDGTGSIDIVRGRLADQSGSIGFTCWGPFEHGEGQLVRIEGASIRRFRETPEINIGDRTKVEVYIDNAFPDAESLESVSQATISGLRDGMREVHVTVQVESLTQRTFQDDEGNDRSLWSGEVIDPTGRCRMTVWCDAGIDSGSFLSLSGVRVRAWQGTPDLTVDREDQIEVLSDAPWDEIDPETHVFDLSLSDLESGGSRSGIRTSGTIDLVRDDSGIVRRCVECRRVLRDGSCHEHGHVEGNEDLRLRMVIDDGLSTASVVLGREPSERHLGESFDEVKARIDDGGPIAFHEALVADLFGTSVDIRGRAIVDDRGVMLLADRIERKEMDGEARAAAVMECWEVVL